MTPYEELQHINEALESTVVVGQSYKVGTHSKTNVAYELLLQRKKELEAELLGDSSLMPRTSVAVFGGR